MVPAVWIAAFSTYPAEAISQPEMAVPMPAPTLIPKEEQANMVPSILLPWVRKVCSEQDAIRALKPPCMGLVPMALIPVNTSMQGMLPKYALIIIPSRPMEATA